LYSLGQICQAVGLQVGPEYNRIFDLNDSQKLGVEEAGSSSNYSDLYLGGFVAFLRPLRLG
jgi:hypothetical protein